VPVLDFPTRLCRPIRPEPLGRSTVFIELAGTVHMGQLLTQSMSSTTTIR